MSDKVQAEMPKKVQSDYNIDDEVWFLGDYGIEQGKVIQVEVLLNKKAHQVDYVVECTYDKVGKHETVNNGRCFPDRKTLVAFILTPREIENWNKRVIDVNDIGQVFIQQNNMTDITTVGFKVNGEVMFLNGTLTDKIESHNE